MERGGSEWLGEGPGKLLSHDRRVVLQDRKTAETGGGKRCGED